MRGYENATLGPTSNRYYPVKNNRVDDNPEEIGGNALAQVGTELILPMPFKGDWADQIRPVLFVEGHKCLTPPINMTKSHSGWQSVSLLNEKDNNMRFSAGAGFT